MMPILGTGLWITWQHPLLIYCKHREAALSPGVRVQWFGWALRNLLLACRRGACGNLTSLLQIVSPVGRTACTLGTGLNALQSYHRLHDSHTQVFGFANGSMCCMSCEQRVTVAAQTSSAAHIGQQFS